MHVEKVDTVLDTLRKVGLTANPSKCAIGLMEAKYLWYIMRRGVVKPQLNKLEAIQSGLWVIKKKQGRAFLGIVGHYRQFIPHFTTGAYSLTDFIKASNPDVVKWTSAAKEASVDLRTALCSSPVLVAPDFQKEFVLQTDASKVGLGAIVSLMVAEEDHPVLSQ
ncbi:unnamed protein product [Caretta caretta]